MAIGSGNIAHQDVIFSHPIKWPAALIGMFDSNDTASPAGITSRVVLNSRSRTTGYVLVTHTELSKGAGLGRRTLARSRSMWRRPRFPPPAGFPSSAHCGPVFSLFPNQFVKIPSKIMKLFPHLLKLFIEATAIPRNIFHRFLRLGIRLRVRQLLLPLLAAAQGTGASAAAPFLPASD